MTATSVPAREILLRTQPNLNFFPNIKRTRPGIPERGEPPGEQSIASEITNGRFVGPIADQLEPEIFVSAHKTDLAELGNFEATGSDRLHVVSRKLKDVIEGLNTPKSEFIPVKVSLLAEGRSDPTAAGGGKIVDGAYWLWNCYNWLDLIDDELSTSTDDPGYHERIRGDLPGSPVQSVHYWGSTTPTSGRKLVLKPIDYTANPFFRIVGLEGDLFLGMAAADALKEAGLLKWEGDMRIAYMELDLLTPPSLRAPTMRVFGTDVLIFNERVHPFPSFPPQQF